MPKEFRIAVYLADVEGFAYEEIAHITGHPAKDMRRDPRVALSVTDIGSPSNGRDPGTVVEVRPGEYCR